MRGLEFGIGVPAYVAMALAFTWSSWSWSELRKDGNLASWVQAIGSIVAILIAIAVPAVQVAMQRRRDEAADRLELDRRTEQAAWIFRRGAVPISNAMRYVNHRWTGGNKWDTAKLLSQLEESMRLLHQAMLVPLPGQAVFALAGAANAISTLIGLVHTVDNDSGAFNSAVQEVVQDLVAELEVAEQAMRDLTPATTAFEPVAIGEFQRLRIMRPR
jgi:hypothetical protein